MSPGSPARQARKTARLADAGGRAAGGDVVDEQPGALCRQPAGVDELLREVLDGCELVVRVTVEEQRVGGGADDLLLGNRELGWTEVLERLDDPAIGLGAITVH